MPGPPVWVCVESVGEGAMGREALRRGRRLFDRRPDEGVAEREGLPVDGDEVGSDRRIENIRSNSGSGQA